VEKSELSELVAQLYAALHLLSGYPVPETLPRVVTMPKAALQNLICDRPCQVRAVYFPALGVLVDDALNLRGSEYDRSIVLHELVHHAQERAGRFETLPSNCQRRAASEDEAYQIQNRYLMNKAQEPMRMPRFGLACGDEGSTPPVR